MKIELNEAQLHHLVTKYIGGGLADLKRTTHDKYCSYDAENDKYLVEYKCRRKFYEESTMLEKPKFDKNISHPTKQYLYIVFDGEDKVQVWNVSKLYEDGYDFGWADVPCPWTTDFDNNEKRVKRTGFLKWDDAYYTLPLTKKDNG